MDANFPDSIDDRHGSMKNLFKNNPYIEKLKDIIMEIADDIPHDYQIRSYGPENLEGRQNVQKTKGFGILS